MTGNPMRRNVPLLYAFSDLRMALFPIPVITLFWKDHIGLTLTEIMILQAIFSVVVVVTEFPAGYVADRIGYRKSLIFSTLFFIAGWIVYSVGRDFAAMAAAETLLGVGISFYSGSDSALLYSSLTAEERGNYVKYEGRMRGAAQASEAATSAVGGWLYSLSPRLPFWLQVPASALALFAALLMREPRRNADPPLPHGRRIANILRTALRANPRLASAIWLGVILGLSSFFMVWLIQPYMKERHIPEGLFGPIWAAANLWVALASFASHNIVRTLGVSGALLGCCLLVGAGHLLLALTGSWHGFLFYFLIMTFRGVQNPIIVGEIQKEANDADRASILSLKSMIFRLVFVVCGPLVGALHDYDGMRTTLLVLAASLTGLSLVALAAFHRTRNVA